MKKITFTLLGLVLAAATAFASAADFSYSKNLSLLDGTAGFGPLHEFAAGSLDKTFSDTYYFSIPALSNAASNVSAISFDDTTGVDFTLFSLYKVGSATAAATGSLNELSGLWSLSGTNLSSGDYFFKVEGTITTNDFAIYSGNVTVSAVPEAETYAMLLAGLGLVGVIARRRKSVV
jgi:hypothetical protein